MASGVETTFDTQHDQRLAGDARNHFLARLPKQAVCAEIGVWTGDFSDQILSMTLPRELHLIDPWSFQPIYPNRWYGGGAAKSQADMDGIHQSVVRRFQGCPNVWVHRLESHRAAEQFATATFDWVYIDANHCYEAVKQDLATWLPKLKPNGLLTGDDVNWPGEDGSRPVRRALQDFLNEREIGNAIVENNQFMIQVPGAKSENIATTANRAARAEET